MTRGGNKRNVFVILLLAFSIMFVVMPGVIADINSSALISQPFNTTFSPFTNLFGMMFFVIPVGFIGAALYVSKRDIALTGVWFIIASVLLCSVSGFVGAVGASMFYGFIAVVGIASLVFGVFYGRGNAGRV